MSKSEGRQVLADAKREGAVYARNQIESETFNDYVVDQVYSANLENLPTTKKESARVARSMLTDLYNDINRDLRHQDVMRLAGASGLFSSASDDYIRDYYGITAREVTEAFNSGMSKVLDRKNVESWLADEILFRSKERRDSAYAEQLRHG